MDVIYVRPERCMGCKSCEINCCVVHSKDKNLFSAIMQDLLPKKRVFAEWTDGRKIPVLCRHCEDAPCIKACISGCLYSDERGFVRRKKERCIGCWSCIMVCPFGVITRDEKSHIAVKCDRCHKMDMPACVEGCPTRALVLMDIDRIPREKRRQLILREIETLN